MRWKYTLPLRFRSIFFSSQVERELNEELQFHIEMKTEQGIAGKLSVEQARLEALRAMDGLEQKKEEIRDMRQIQWFTDFVQDLRYAWRGLMRTRGFTMFIVITLALGIGLNSAIFSLADALLLRPIPVPKPGEVMNVVSTSPTEQFGEFSWKEYLHLRDRDKSFESLVAFTDMKGFGMSPRHGELPQMCGGILVSENFFRELRVEPAVGRSFVPDEFRVEGRDAVLVLGNGFWKRRFASDPSVIGREILMNGIPFRVVGIAPEAFTGMDTYTRPDFFAPLAIWPRLATDTKSDPLEDRKTRALNIKGRLRSGVSLATAQAEVAVIAKQFAAMYPQTNLNRGASAHTDLQIRIGQDQGDAAIAGMMMVLAGAVLVVACANVAGLLLSRARTRSREIAVRLSIGASRFRLIRLLLTESLLLALMGGAFGLVIAFFGVKFLGSYHIPSELPIVFSVQLDHRVLLVSLIVTLASAMLFGLAPAIQSTGTNLVDSLKMAGADIPGRRRLWGRNALVVAQVACSLAVLIVAAQLINGFNGVWGKGGGFRTDHLLMMTFDPRMARLDESQTQQFYRDLLARSKAAAGVKTATLSEGIPLFFPGAGISFVPEGFNMPRGQESFSSQASSVSENYFEVMRIGLVRGRGVLASDKADSPRVAVVNEVFATHYWPGQDAIGKRFRLDDRKGPLVEVVGVAKTAKYGWLGEAPTEFAYLSMAQRTRAEMTLLIETRSDPSALAAPLRDIVRRLNANIPTYDVRTMEDFYANRAYAVPLMLMQTVSALGLTGLVLAVAGLYGLVAYAVSRRTREIGIRMAIGADRRAVLNMVMGQGLVLVATGAVLGVALGQLAGRGIGTLFSGVGPDLIGYLAVIPLMMLVTMLAAYIPARRASRVEPMQALRYE